VANGQLYESVLSVHPTPAPSDPPVPNVLQTGPRREMGPARKPAAGEPSCGRVESPSAIQSAPIQLGLWAMRSAVAYLFYFVICYGNDIAAVQLRRRRRSGIAL